MRPTIEAVIMTTERFGTPHLDALRASNPGMPLHVNEGRHGTTEAERQTLWRNCDRSIRDWWRSNRDRVQAPAVAFLEWDVLCNAPLAKIMPPFTGLVGRIVAPVEEDPNWVWFCEIERLPSALRSFATSLRPLGALIASRPLLDAIVSPEFDDLFNADIFCELRLPTLARFLGFRVAHAPAFRRVECFPIPHPGPAPGIWHAVKSACNLDPSP